MTRERITEMWNFAVSMEADPSYVVCRCARNLLIKEEK